MIDGAITRSPLPGYSIIRVYLIICDKCNEDITRTQTGDDIKYVTEARKAIKDHDKLWHPQETTGEQAE